LNKKIFVVCVDRDNDLGRKAKINGPIIGERANIEAAQKLILADPEESDANTMFAAIRKYREALKLYKNAEVVTITGQGKIGLEADKEINKQLDELQKGNIIEGWIVVTDGMEDNQVLPLLQSRAKIISTEQITIKQAKEVESAFYTVKEALKDPSVSRLIFGIPGILLLTYFVIGNSSIQLLTLLAGLYLIIKGFGIEEKVFENIKIVFTSLVEQRLSVIFYLSATFSILFGAWAVYVQLITLGTISFSPEMIGAVRVAYPYLAIAGMLFCFGRVMDMIHSKKAYVMGKYIIQAASILSVWIILESGTLVFLRQIDLNWFPASIMLGILIMVIVMRAASIIDIRKKVTKILIGLTVMDEMGNHLGKIIEVNKDKQTVKFAGTGNKRIEKKLNQIVLRNGRIIVLGN
jgi:putative membrane protein